MTAGLIVLAGRMPARDRNGRSTIGRLRVYQNSTTTEVSVYSSAALTTALSQPISSDSAGQFPLIWIDSANTPVTVAYEDDSGQTQTYENVTASTAAAAAIVNAYAGAVSFEFSTTTTDADPGAGKVRFDNATIASVTNVYIDNTSLAGGSVTGWLDSFDDANTTTNRGTIAFRSLTDTSVFVLLKVTGAVTDGTGYRKIPVAYLSGSLPADATELVMGFAAAGPASLATVTAGTATTLATTASPTVANSGTSAAAIFDFGIPRGAPGGVLYTFSTTTTDSDPGAGKVRFNNATPASITAAYFDNADANGNTVTGWLDAVDDSTNTVKGSLVFRQLSNGRVITFNVTGSVVDGTGYRKLTVAHTAGATLFDNDAEISVSFERAGDKGADGTGSGDVNGPASATANAVAQFDGTTGKLLKSGPSIGTSANNLVQLDSSAKLPAVDGSQLTNVGLITRSARTSNTQLAASDKGKSIEYTTGGFTQTLAACSSLGAGWFVYVVNSSTGDVTFDPNGSETIGGVNAATTAVLKPGQSAILITDGSNLYFAGAPTSFRNMEIFTSGGTFTPKPGVSRYYIKAVGGGGGGSYGGGASGGYAEGWADITSSQTITIGSGGGSGSSGGTTSVGSIVTCNGGSGGATGSSGAPSSGGTATFSGGLTLRGGDGDGHNNGGTYGGSGGASPFGGAGAAANNSNSGTSAGSNTGSGGGGNATGSGGSGGSGLVLIMW